MRKTANTPNNAKNNTTREFFNLSETLYKLHHVKWSEDGKTCRFSLSFMGIDLYGITLRYDKDGNPWFAFPSWKNREGNFFKYFYLAPDEATMHAIVSALEGM